MDWWKYLTDQGYYWADDEKLLGPPPAPPAIPNPLPELFSGFKMLSIIALAFYFKPWK